MNTALRKALALAQSITRPLCPHCLITDPANQETGAGCHRRRPVSVRTPSGPLCSSCRPWKTATCGICGRTDRVRGGTRAEPLCATCTRSDAGFWTSCPACGETGLIHAGRCARCAVSRRLHELLGDGTREIRPHLRAAHRPRPHPQ